MNVYSFEIPKPINENLIVQEDSSMPVYNKLHRHEEIQITYIVKGSGKLFIPTTAHPFESGDFFVVGSNYPHSFRNNTPDSECHRISLFFTFDAFGNNFFEISQLDQIRSFFGLLDCGFKLTSYKPSIDRLMRKLPYVDKLKRFILFIELIGEVCKCEKEFLGKFVTEDGVRNIVDFRMKRVLDYTLTNFKKEITLELISDVACMSPNAFCRFFKQRTCKTFFSYLTELRIAYACKLLRQNKNLSIASISNISGFNSITNFNRMFKNYIGVTPSNYIHQLELV